MPQLRLRVTGSEEDARTTSNLLSSIEGIEHVEEVADLMEHMDDDDSSSAGLPDDQGPGVHELEIDAPNFHCQEVPDAVSALAFDLAVLVEFESDEEWGE